jgi:DNA primase
MTLFSFIKSRLSILDVIGEYAALKKAGLYYKASCPFHAEKTASFTVSPHKEIFYCFGCQTTGDVISFIARTENCSQFEAAQHLIDRYGLEVPHTIAHEYKEPNGKKRYFELCKTVTDWCRASFEKSSVAQNYFLKRGFNASILKQFEVGYFPGGLHANKDLITFAGTKKFLAADLLDTHILEQGRQVMYSPFEERLMFPIKDHLGRHCGFGGRIFKEQDTRAKYYNSRENEFFVKGSLLFGLDQAKKAIQEKGSVFLVEGYTDCLAMVQHGYPHTVATLGTACTLEHLKILARHTPLLYVLYDGDAAGKNAILRLAEMCWEVNVDLFVVKLPPGEDPASFLANGKDLSAPINAAQDIFMFYVDSLGAPFSTLPLGEKLRSTQRLLGLIKHLDDQLKRDLLLQRASQVLGIPLSSLTQELERLKDARPQPTLERQSDPQQAEAKISQEGPDGLQKLAKLTLLEKKLFSVIMANIEFLGKTDAVYLIKHFSEPLQSILEKVRTRQSQDGTTVGFVDFFDSLSTIEQQVITQLMLECEEEDPSKTFDHLLTQFQKKHWKSIVQDIKIKINEAEHGHDDQKVKELLATFQEFKKRLLKRGVL